MVVAALVVVYDVVVVAVFAFPVTDVAEVTVAQADFSLRPVLLNIDETVLTECEKRINIRETSARHKIFHLCMTCNQKEIGGKKT